MECHKLSKAFPKGINSLCVSWDHLFMTRDQRVGAISLEAVAQGRFEEEATTIFTVPELESMEPSALMASPVTWTASTSLSRARANIACTPSMSERGTSQVHRRRRPA